MLTAQSQSSHGYSQTPGLLRGLPSLACRSAGEGPARARQSISVAIWHFAAQFFASWTATHKVCVEAGLRSCYASCWAATHNVCVGRHSQERLLVMLS